MSSETPPLRIYYAPDSASLVVRLALEELGVAYETVLMDRKTQGQRSPAYLRRNPHGLIPVIDTPDGPVFETAAILLWLADRHRALAPTPDSPDRGACLGWLFFLSNTLHADLRMTFYADRFVPGPDSAGFLRITRHRITGHLDRVEAWLAGTPAWIDPERPGIVGLYLAVLLRWAALYPVGDKDWFDLSAWPNLAQFARRIETLPAAQRASAAEGLGPTPFSAPTYCNPPEGSAT